MILSCQSICKSFGEKVILQDASFHIEEREKAALIGNNGAAILRSDHILLFHPKNPALSDFSLLKYPVLHQLHARK